MSTNHKPGDFLAVLEANKGIIYKIARTYCRHTDDRRDLIQEIVVQLWLSFGAYDPAYAHSTWIYRIALNTAISFYRKQSRRDAINQPLPDDILYLRDEETHDTIDRDVEYLYAFIRELKEIDRAIILLYLEGRPQQEIAVILGLTPTNISTRVARIKQQLKQKFATIKT